MKAFKCVGRTTDLKPNLSWQSAHSTVKHLKAFLIYEVYFKSQL